jgi:hypothetical protein
MLNGNIGSGMMNGTKVTERQPHFEILPESPQLPRRSPNRAGGADDLHGDESVEDGGGERTPFLPPVTLSPGQAPRKAQDQTAWHLLEGHQPPRASSQFRARIENTLAFMLRHGCGRQLLMLAIVFLTFWLVIFVFVLPVMDAKDLARLKVSCCVIVRWKFAVNSHKGPSFPVPSSTNKITRTFRLTAPLAFAIHVSSFIHSYKTSIHVHNVHTGSFLHYNKNSTSMHTGSKLTVRGAGSVSNARRLQVQTLQCKSCFTCACIAHACVHVLQSVENTRTHTHSDINFVSRVLRFPLYCFISRVILLGWGSRVRIWRSSRWRCRGRLSLVCLLLTQYLIFFR